MTKTKSTKRALLLSALSLLMCVAMLIGSTFAWFTDSVTSAGNTIQSGNLDVDLVDESGKSLEGEVIEFVTADSRAQDQILWEPGCTYETEPVYVVNNGNLALKYQIVINGINGNAKLLEAIDWTVTIGGTETDLSAFEGTLIPGQINKSDAIVLSGHMKEEAGNEYQGLTVEGISIAVYATQYTYESDSFNNQYDAAAEYAATNMLKNIAAVAAGETATVKLESDGYVVLSSQSLVGAVVKGDVTLDLNGKTLFIKAEDVNGHQSLFNIVKGGKLTVKGNGTIEMVSGKNPLVTAIFNNTSGTLIIENGTFKMDHMNNWEDSLIPTIIDNNGNAAGATTIINGGNFYHTRNMFRNFPSNSGITELIINGGTFNGKADDWAAIWNQKASSSTKEGQSLITVNGGEFNYVKIDNEFNTGVTIADGVAIPTPVNTVDDLKDALASDSDVILQEDITFTGLKQTPDRNNYVEVYGNKVGFAQYTGVFDGNGKTLTDAEGDKSYVIVTHGGTIKNVTIKSGARGIVTYNPTENIYIDNVVVDGPGYALNSTEQKPVDMFVTNSTINGWTSLAGFSSVNFTDCKLGENTSKYWQGMGYPQDYDRLFRVYSATKFENCKFEQGYYLDLSAGGTLTLKNCTVNGVKLTAENYGNYITIELPSGKTLADCATIN